MFRKTLTYWYGIAVGTVYLSYIAYSLMWLFVVYARNVYPNLYIVSLFFILILLPIINILGLVIAGIDIIVYTVKEIYKNCFENASQKSPNKTKKVNKFRVIIETILLGMYFAAMFCFILFIPQIKQFPVGIDTLFHPFVG